MTSNTLPATLTGDACRRLERIICETCDTKGCYRPATWEIECRGAGVSGRLIYSCDEHCPDPAILSPYDDIRRVVEE